MKGTRSVLVLVASLVGCDTAAVEEQAKAHASAAASALGRGFDEATQAWLADQAKSANPGSIEAWLGKGTKVIAVAGELSTALDGIVERETMVQPIVQDVPDGEEPKVDAAIEEMSRVEVIDGVKVGFRQVDGLSTESKTSERAYLVMWRRDRRLYGFFYRSKQTVHLDKLVEQAPRIIPLIEKAAV